MKRAIFFVICVTACSSANQNDAEFWDPSLSTTSVDEDAAAPHADSSPPSDDTAPAMDTGPVATGNCLHVEFTTASTGGRYSPSHVEAVWIVDSAGKFVRTLAEYGYKRSSNLIRWRTAGGTTVDAVTGATLKSYGAQKFDWNCKSSSEVDVAPGNYTLFAEFEENDARSVSSAGPHIEVAFTVGKPETVTAPDQKGFSGIVLQVLR